MTTQEQLQVIYRAMRDGHFPAALAPLGPDFARRLAAYRERVDACVHVFDVSPARLVVLCAPTDGGPLYLWQFDALAAPGDQGAPN